MIEVNSVSKTSNIETDSKEVRASILKKFGFNRRDVIKTVKESN